MMSAPDREGMSWKSRCSRGGCMNYILKISSNYGQGGRGSKKPKILRRSLMDAPLPKCEEGAMENGPYI